MKAAWAVLVLGFLLLALAPVGVAQGPDAGVAVEERPEPPSGSHCYAALTGDARCNVEGREARAWGPMPHAAVCEAIETLPWDISTPVPELDRRAFAVWLGAGIVYAQMCNPPYAGVAFEEAVACATAAPASCLSGACTMDYPSSSCNLGPLFWGRLRR